MSFWKKLRGTFKSQGTIDPPSPQELFSAEAAVALREVPGVSSIIRKPDEFALEVLVHGETRTIYLHDVFHESRTMSLEQRRHRVQRLLDGAADGD